MDDALYIVDRPRKTEYAEAAPIEVKYDYTKVSRCPNCGEMIKPHRVCKNCGYYKKEEIIKKDAE